MEQTRDIIDVHCHLMQFGSRIKSFLHPKFLKSIKVHEYFRNLGMINGLDILSLKTQAEIDRLNEDYTERLISNVQQSRLKHAVLLPLDGVYDETGELDKERTSWYVDNDTVIDLAGYSSKVLAAGSINPLRRDWKEELDKCIEKKIALIKWLPNVMGFDPSDERIIPFYEKLFETKIPILSHVGFEYAVDKINDDYSKLEKLKLPLEMGVKVIAAHCCGGRPFVDSKKQFAEVVDAVKKYPNLYLDVSATASIHRRSRLENSINNEYTNERLVFGTDYPIPVHRWAFPLELGIKESLIHRENPFSSNLQIMEAMGLDRDSLSRGYKIINPKSF